MSKAVCPPSSAGLALGAILQMFGTEVDDAAITEVFDGGFLDAVGAENIRQVFADVGAATLVSVDPSSPNSLRSRLRAPGGELARLELVVAGSAPHRIIGLTIRPELDQSSLPFEELLPPPLTVHAGGLDEALAERFTRRLEDIVTAKAITGLAASVVQRGRVAWHASCGWASAEERRPVEARTVFRAYSVTKLVTAIAVLQLWEQHQFDLDDPVNEHLKAMRLEGPGRQITVRDLLSHRSGLGSSGSELLWQTQATSAVDVLGPVIDLPERPGDIAYSNAGYGVLTQLVEDLSGVRFDDYIQSNVFEPLGMISSELRRSDPPGERFAVGHDVAFDEVVSSATEVPSLLGAGGMFTTAPDLAALALAVIGGGANGTGRVVSEEVIALATRPVVAGAPVGLGFFLAEVSGRACVWHNGGGRGFSSALYVAPTGGAAVALLANTSGRTGQPGGLEADAIGMLEEVLDGVG